jgi:hypothetical protein
MFAAPEATRDGYFEYFSDGLAALNGLGVSKAQITKT